MSETTPAQPSSPGELPHDTASKTGQQTEEIAIEAEIDENQQPAPSAARRAAFLYRHPQDKMVGGICAGLGDYLNIDPVLVRIMWVGLTIGTAGAGLFAYAALWLLLPVGTAQAGQHAPAALELNERNVGRAGLLLVVVGILWLLVNFGVLPAIWHMFWGVISIFFWPALLIFAGFLLLKNQKAWRGRLFNARAKVQDGTTRAASGLNGESLKGGLRRAKAAIPFKRSRQDRLVFGVCGSIGRAIGLDSNLVRLIWVAFAIGSVGTGVLIYVLCGWLLPEEAPALEPAYVSEPQDSTVIEGAVN